MLSEIFIVAITPDLKFSNIDALSSFSKPLIDFAIDAFTFSISPQKYRIRSRSCIKFIEIGPGKVLSGLVKRINKDVKISSINSQSDIESLKIWMI